MTGNLTATGTAIRNPWTLFRATLQDCFFVREVLT
jgi:hypothetical protein